MPARRPRADSDRDARVAPADTVAEVERLLWEREAQYRAIFEAAGDGLEVWDLETERLVEVNPAHCRMHGFTRAELLSDPTPQFIHPDDAPLFRSFLDTVRKGGEFRGRVRDLRKDGTIVPVEVVGKTFTFNGKPHVLGVLRDISEQERAETERQSAQAELERSEKRFRALIEHSSDVITLTRPDGILSYASPSTTWVLGYDPAELVGGHALARVHADDCGIVGQAIDEVQEAPRKCVVARYRTRHRDGSWRWVETTLTNLLDEPAVGAIVANQRDVSAPPDAGTFWYHPHANETEQLEKGLYGALIVRAADELTLDGEKLLVFDDVRVDKTGQIAKFGGLMDRHNGREGNVRLINGSSEPEFAIAAGQIERWRIVNASSARYIRLSLGGLPFQIIGTDGGFIEAPVAADEVLLPPGDRVEVAVGPFEAEGEVYGIDDLPFNRGTGKKRIERFGTIRVDPRKASSARIPTRLREITPLVTGTPTVTRTVNLGFKMSLRRGFDFVIDGERLHHAEPVNVGDLQVWDVVNSTQIDHPFHLHGFFFQVLEIDGKEPAWRSLEDVVNVPPKKTVRIAWYPDDRPGMWMYHCHILEHHDAGMMAHFEVKRP